MRATILPLAIILTEAHRAKVSLMAKGPPINIYVSAISMQYFTYFDKREVVQQEYSQPPILPSHHFRWIVKPWSAVCHVCIIPLWLMSIFCVQMFEMLRKH